MNRLARDGGRNLAGPGLWPAAGLDSLGLLEAGLRDLQVRGAADTLEAVTDPPVVTPGHGDRAVSELVPGVVRLLKAH